MTDGTRLARTNGAGQGIAGFEARSSSQAEARLSAPAARPLPAASRPAARPSQPAARPGVRDQILEAALREFADKGFQESSLAAIARRVGVTAPLILYHFGSKANLWRQALEVFCSGFSSVIDGAVAEGREAEGREALRLVVMRLSQFFAANRSAYRLMRDDGGTGSGHGEWFASRRLRPVVRQIEVVYKRAVDEGAVRPAPFETTFFMILGAISCYLESRDLVTHLFESATEDSDQFLESYTEQVLALVFDGLSVSARRSESVRPMLAALRAAPQQGSSIPSASKEAALA
jgi:TetR/AcrR family transcriptional regulator